jgi:glycosyltransferase A (GT-A) superfamily protein (DUF2064 family)
MKRMRHAAVLFTKYPQPGVTKTRLIEENGGGLTAEMAADLYRAMVLDTASVALHALDACRRRHEATVDFDLYVSSSPEADLPKVTALFSKEFPDRRISYLCDRGRNFDEHFNDTFAQLFARGHDSVVCVGGDLPSITPDLLVRSFEWLIQRDACSSNGAMVLAPCQAAGVSLVGVTRSAAVDFAGVFYNTAGCSALDALIRIAEDKGIPTALNEALFDVDLMEDLGHMIAVMNATEYASRFQPELLVPRRTLGLIREWGLSTTTPANTAHDPRGRHDG